jgi:hypothetical protein
MAEVNAVAEDVQEAVPQGHPQGPLPDLPHDHEDEVEVTTV